MCPYVSQNVSWVQSVAISFLPIAHILAPGNSNQNLHNCFSQVPQLPWMSLPEASGLGNLTSAVYAVYAADAVVRYL